MVKVIFLQKTPFTFEKAINFNSSIGNNADAQKCSFK